MRRFLIAPIIACGLAAVLYAQQPAYLVTGPSGTVIPVATTTELTAGTSTPTWASAVIGLAPMLRASTAIPAAVTADRPVAPLASTSGAQAMFPTGYSIGGANTCYITSAATTNSTNCKNAQGTIYDISLVNTTATLYYLRLYNLSAAPTCSSATGFVETIPAKASATGADVQRQHPVGRNYSAGIGFCLTGGGSSTDNTNAATGVYISIGYF